MENIIIVAIISFLLGLATIVYIMQRDEEKRKEILRKELEEERNKSNEKYRFMGNMDTWYFNNEQKMANYIAETVIIKIMENRKNGNKKSKKAKGKA